MRTSLTGNMAECRCQRNSRDVFRKASTDEIHEIGMDMGQNSKFLSVRRLYFNMLLYINDNNKFKLSFACRYA